MVPMKDKTVADELRGRDERDIDELAASVLGAVHADARLFVETSVRPEDPAWKPAGSVLADLAEVAIVPLLAPPLPKGANERAWVMRMAAGQEGDLGQKVAARIDSLLEDRERGGGPDSERACDTAYLLMASGARWKPGALQERAAFLKGPDGSRDAHIAAARESETWKCALGGATVEDFRSPGKPDAGGARSALASDARSVLGRLASVDYETQSSLSASLAQRERRPGREAVDAFLDADTALSRKAQRLLVGLQDLAILPLVERTAPKVEQRQWMIRRASEAEGELRRNVFAGLESLLEDKRLLSRSIPRGAERVPPPSRVCDEAYLEIHRLIHRGETLDEERDVQDALRLAPDDQRDAIIRKGRQSGAW